MKPYTFVFFLILLAVSCTEDYQLETLQDSRILVVEGCITNEEGPYFIRLHENISNLSSGSSDITRQPVKEARVTISDDLGNTDELKPVWKSEIAEIEKEYVRYNPNDGTPIYYTIVYRYLLIPNYQGTYDSIALENYSTPFEYFEGMYMTTSINGVPGRTYTLNIENEGETYTATDYMNFGTVIDSVTLKPIGLGGENKGMDGFDIPFIYFAEPQDEENYYLFTYASVYTIDDGRDEYEVASKNFKDIVKEDYHESVFNWMYSVVNDRFMSPYMSEYKVDDGSTVRAFLHGQDAGWDIWSNKLDIYMASISRPAYNYYIALTEQFYQDGGAFSPSPAPPPSNLSNGAQGFFMAASVSVCRTETLNSYW